MNTNVLTRTYLFLGGLGAISLIAYGIYKNYEAAGPIAVPAPVAQPAPVDVKVVAVMTASRPIARGQVVARDDVTTTQVYGSAPVGSFTAMVDVVGKVATADISGQQLLLDSVISADPAKAGLAALVPPGYRAISILTNDEIAVSDMVRPGDRVDIQLVLPDAVLNKQAGLTGPAARAAEDQSEARTVLQDVLVLTVGSTLGDPATARQADGSARRDNARTISLAMTADQISQFALARSLGSFYLALRSPDDAQLIKDNTAKLVDIRGPEPPATAPVPPQRRAIELIVGDRSQLIYPSKSGDVR